jgi:hypothetical protein
MRHAPFMILLKEIGLVGATPTGSTSTYTGPVTVNVGTEVFPPVTAFLDLAALYILQYRR